MGGIDAADDRKNDRPLIGLLARTFNLAGRRIGLQIALRGFKKRREPRSTGLGDLEKPERHKAAMIRRARTGCHDCINLAGIRAGRDKRPGIARASRHDRFENGMGGIHCGVVSIWYPDYCFSRTRTPARAAQGAGMRMIRRGIVTSVADSIQRLNRIPA